MAISPSLLARRAIETSIRNPDACRCSNSVTALGRRNRTPQEVAPDVPAYTQLPTAFRSNGVV
jgi:hypothetical protein